MDENLTMVEADRALEAHEAAKCGGDPVAIGLARARLMRSKAALEALKREKAAFAAMRKAQGGGGAFRLGLGWGR